MKKLLVGIASLFLLCPTVVFADAQPGDMIITLGSDLTQGQRSAMLEELNATDNAIIVEVTNAEEHKYLGQYIPKAQIGTRALSSASITIGEKNSGIAVVTRNINWVTNDMYTNALITAGVKDAVISITSPIEGVSGTAALTGLIKAYEVSTGEVISEEQKQVANEEMVTSAKLAEELGADETNSLMTNIKEEIAKQKPKTEEEVKGIVQNAAEEAGITLTEDQKARLVALFDKMKDLDIDWHAVGEQLDKAKEKFTNFIESETGQGLIESVKSFFVHVWEFIKGLFASEPTTNGTN